MVSGRWIIPHASKPLGCCSPVRVAGPSRVRLWVAIVLLAVGPRLAWAEGCFDAEGKPGKPVYLTLDTGHMAVAPLMADILAKHQVRVTFFGANERTQTGDGSLGRDWAPWWKARAAEGHEFASHTFDHTYWRGDVAPDGRSDGPPRARPAAPEGSAVREATSVGAVQFRVRPSAGPQEGRESVWTAAQYCAEIAKAASRLEEITGKKPLPLFRAPGGKTSPKLLAAAKACGYEHVGWSPAGFLGDELSSEAWPNDQLLKKALRDIRAGDILLAHLGIWSRKDPWAPAVLEPLLTGLKERGFCFATLGEHPRYKAWITQQAGQAPPRAAK
jgi:peptidoglycan/xylan/chitin deacetylase (PgdA/CDA1 family)